jgi:thioredoxin-related protein
VGKIKFGLLLLLLTCCTPSADQPLQKQKPPLTIHIPATAKSVKAIDQSKKADVATDKIQWQEMSGATFLQAESERKLIMLYFNDPTCEMCTVFERATLADPRVVANINEHFVPIIVPDKMKEEVLNAFGQLITPSVMFLSPDGEHLITIPGFVPPSKFNRILEVMVQAAKEIEKSIELQVGCDENSDEVYL